MRFQTGSGWRSPASKVLTRWLGLWGCLGLSACATFGLAPDSDVPSDRAHAASADWRPQSRARVAHRSFEAFRLGQGPRLVWIPTEGGRAVSIQTWVRHQQRGEALPRVGLLDAAVAALRLATQSGPQPLDASVGRDATRLNIRTTAALDRWSQHLGAHADWLCRPVWSDDQLTQAIDRIERVIGWESVSHRLVRSAWRARTGASRSSRGPIVSDDLRLALAAWLRPSRAVVVVTGPVERQAVLDAAAAHYRGCRQERRDEEADVPRLRHPDRIKIRVPGPHRHLLLSWSVPRLPPRTRAALDAIALALGDPITSPLGPSLTPELAQGIAVRHRHHTAGADLEILMTLAPTATASAAVTRTQRVLRTLAVGDHESLRRALAGIRNRTLRRLSTLDGPGDFAAHALLNGETLDDMARRLSVLTNSTPNRAEQVQRLAEEYLLRRPPLVILGVPRGRR